MSAQARHSGPGPSMTSRSPVPEHSAQAQSLSGMTTTRSGGRLWRSADRRRFASDSAGEAQCAR